VSASHDKSIRVWEQTDEQIFLEEERDRELEELYENTLATSLEQDQEKDDEAEIGAVSKHTVETLTAGEKIAEALEIGMADLELMKDWEAAKITQPKTAQPPRNPLFIALGGVSAEAHVLSVLEKTNASALQDAILVLPFSTVPSLFTFINIFAMRSMNIPLACRILFFLLKVHHSQIVASKTMRPMLDGIRGNLRGALKKQKDEMGYNLAALKVIGSRMKESAANYVDEDTLKEQVSPRKRGFVSVS
jgi:U3 small nucleolar RNA-associated protein 12